MPEKKKVSNVLRMASVKAPTLGLPPQLRPEETAGYDELAARIFQHVKPSDPIEELYTRDIIDLAWELLRYRHNKELLLENALPRALEEKLAPFVNGNHRFGSLPRYAADGALEPTPAMELVNDWMKGERKAIACVDKVLASARMTMEDVRAHAFLLQLGTVERLDRLIASVEGRRNGVLREIEGYRASLAHALKAATHEVEGTQFEVLTHQSPGSEMR